MRGPAMVSLALLVACGAQVGTSQQFATDAGDDDPADGEVPPDVAPLGPFGPVSVVPGANNANASDDDGTLSHSGLELVFSLVDGDNRKHLYLLTRASTAVPFAGPPVRLAFNQNGATSQTPRFSEDDLTLFFADDRDPNTDGLDIYSTTRPAGGAFGTAITKLPGIDDADDDDKWYMPCAGGRFLMISNRAGNEDIFEGVGAGAPTRSAELSSAQSETGTFLTPDCLTVYFASTRSGDNRIYTSTRTAADQPWPAPTEVTDFLPLAGEDQEDPWLSPDGRTFVLSSNRNGTKDVFISTR